MKSWTCSIMGLCYLFWLGNLQLINQSQHLPHSYLSLDSLSVEHGLLSYSILRLKHLLLKTWLVLLCIIIICLISFPTQKWIKAFGKLLTVEALMYIFDKELLCIYCQIKLMLRFAKQAFHAISRNKLFDHPTIS